MSTRAAPVPRLRRARGDARVVFILRARDARATRDYSVFLTFALRSLSIFCRRSVGWGARLRTHPRRRTGNTAMRPVEGARWANRVREGGDPPNARKAIPRGVEPQRQDEGRRAALADRGDCAEGRRGYVGRLEGGSSNLTFPHQTPWPSPNPVLHALPWIGARILTPGLCVPPHGAAKCSRGKKPY